MDDFEHSSADGWSKAEGWPLPKQEQKPEPPALRPYYLKCEAIQITQENAEAIMRLLGGSGYIGPLGYKIEGHIGDLGDWVVVADADPMICGDALFRAQFVEADPPSS